MNSLVLLWIHRIQKHPSLFLGSLLTLFFSSFAQASPLFEGTNGNIWVLDKNGNIIERRIDVTQPNWLSNFLVNGNPVLTLGQEQQAVINQVENSSISPTQGQPVMSLVGFASAPNASPGVQPAALQISPDSGNFDETLRVQLRIPKSLISSQATELSWSINGTEEKLTLTNEQMKKLESSNGFLVKSLFLVRNGTYAIQAAIKENGANVSQANANLTLSSNHPDGVRRDTNKNGLPDLVELAIGLNPLESNWQYDSDNNGWSDFDEWLRKDRLGDNGLPLDTDKDGWSDFDEELRQTNPKDAAVVLADANAPQLSLAQKNRYRDVPVAGSLYEPEYVIGATIEGESAEDAWVFTGVKSIAGISTYDTQKLLTEEEIAKTTLDPSAIPNHKVLSRIKAKINKPEPIVVRLPSQMSQVLSTTFSKPQRTEQNPQAAAKPYQSQHWLLRKSELTPLYFQQNNASIQWSSALEWKKAYIQYLRDNLVTKLSIQPNIDSTLDTVFVSAFLSQEAKYQNITDLILVGSNGTTSASRLNISDLEAQLFKRSEGSAYTLDTVYGVFKTAREGNNTLSSLFNTLKNKRSENSLLSQAKLVDQINSDDTSAYHIRLYPIPNALLQIAIKQDLLSFDLDIDNDGLSNKVEVSQPMSKVTYPWNSDTDQDKLVDGNDNCPLDPLNLCQASAPKPKLMVSMSSTFSEPSNTGEAQSFAIISFSLDKKYDEAVTVQYQSADEEGGAVEGVDYTKVVGTLTIPAGEQVGFLLIPILPDALEEKDERFLLNITQVTGAEYSASEPVVVVIKDTQLNPNAPVINSTPKFMLASGESLNMSNAELLANASDPNDESLSIGAIVNMPAKGTLTQNVNGFVYNSVTEIDNLIASGNVDFVTHVAPDYIMYRELDGDKMRFKTYQVSTQKAETILEVQSPVADFKGFITRDDWDGAYFSAKGPFRLWTPGSGLTSTTFNYDVKNLSIDPKSSAAYVCYLDGFRKRWYRYAPESTNSGFELNRNLISEEQCDPDKESVNARIGNKFCIAQENKTYCIDDTPEGEKPAPESFKKVANFLYQSEVAAFNTIPNQAAAVASVFVDASVEDYRPRVAISGDWLVASDGSYDHYRGIVKLYRLDNGTWKYHQSIRPSSSDHFAVSYGNRMAISDSHLMLLKSNSEIHFYSRNASKATEQWEFKQAFSIPLPDSYKDLSSVFIPNFDLSPDGQTLAVGRQHFAREDYVYIYQKDTSTNNWVLKQTITEQADATSFGFDLAFSNNLLLVGDPSYTDGQRTGRVWAYKKQNESYELEHTFIVPDLPGPPQRFGHSLAISKESDLVVIGTPSTGSYGTAYAYEKTSSGWSSHIELRRNDKGNAYGASVEISDGFIYVSSYSDLGVVDAYQKGPTGYVLRNRFEGDATKRGLGTSISAGNGYLMAAYSNTKDGAFNIYKASQNSIELAQSVALLTPPVSRFSIFKLDTDAQGNMRTFKLADIPAESKNHLSMLPLSDGSALFSAYSEASHKLFKWSGISNELTPIDIPQPSSVSDPNKVIGAWAANEGLVYLTSQYSDTQKQVIKITPSNNTAESELIFNATLFVPNSIAVADNKPYVLKGNDAGCSIHSLLSPDTPAVSNIACLPLTPLPNGWLVNRANAYRYLLQQKVKGQVEFTIEVKNQSQLVTPMKIEIEVK